MCTIYVCHLPSPTTATPPPEDKKLAWPIILLLGFIGIVVLLLLIGLILIKLKLVNLAAISSITQIDGPPAFLTDSSEIEQGSMAVDEAHINYFSLASDSDNAEDGDGDGDGEGNELPSYDYQTPVTIKANNSFGNPGGYLPPEDEDEAADRYTARGPTDTERKRLLQYMKKERPLSNHSNSS